MHAGSRPQWMVSPPGFAGYRHKLMWDGQIEAASLQTIEDRTRPVFEFMDALRKHGSFFTESSLYGDLLVHRAANLSGFSHPAAPGYHKRSPPPH